MNLKAYFEGIPLIEGRQIRLRALKETDAATLFEYYHNEAVYRYLDWNGPQTLEMAREVIGIWNRGFEEGWILRFAIAEKETDTVIGTIFLGGFDGKRAEIGYELSEKMWRCGIMSEAIGEVLKLGFNKMGLKRIQAFTRLENEASQKILKKCSFREEGLLRQYECHHVTGECNDVLIFGLLKEEFCKAQIKNFIAAKE